eukprot:715791-Lingulodinium_polyedra.AAC.1
MANTSSRFSAQAGNGRQHWQPALATTTAARTNTRTMHLIFWHSRADVRGVTAMPSVTTPEHKS